MAVHVAQAQIPAPAAANPGPALSPRAVAALLWLYLASDTRVGLRDSLVGGVLTWVKAVSLLCLVCWVVAWLIIGVKERLIGQGRWFDFLGIAAHSLTPIAVMLKVLEDAKKIAPYRIGAYSLTTVVAGVCVLCFVIWAEVATWRTIRKIGRRTDALVHVAIHIALAVGVAVGMLMYTSGFLTLLVQVQPDQTGVRPRPRWVDGLDYGVRFGATYMGLWSCCGSWWIWSES